MEQGWVWDLDDFAVNQFGHPVPGQQLLQRRPRQRPELLGVGGGHGVRQRHLGVLRRNEPCLAERFHQHDAGRHRARRDVPSRGVARAGHAQDRQAAALERDRRDGARPDHRREPLHQRRRVARDRQTERLGADRASPASASMGVLWRGIEAGEFDGTPRSVPRNGPALRRRRARAEPDARTTRSPFGSASAAAPAFSEVQVRGRLLGQPLGDRRTAVQRPPGLRVREQRRLPPARSRSRHPSA